MDTGPIYLVKRFALDDDMSSDELFAELSELGAEALLETISIIEKGGRPTPQSTAGISKAAKISKAEAEIDWRSDAVEISRRVRAFTSNPGAWTTFRGTTIKLDTPKVESVILNPGEILIHERKLLVGTSTSAISFEFITPQGKSRIDSRSWINGARLDTGDHFG
jgi:methionyl-tRNA formyltransferase